MSHPFDPEAYEKEVLRSLMPFQRATVEAIDRIFHIGGGMAQRRVLVADEVGLGKTIVARGVIAKLARQRILEEGDDLFKVAYVCSSQNIVRQNLDKLFPGQKNVVDTETGESRLSMQHLLVAEGDAKRKARGEKVQRIPITPETSFRMGKRMGTKQERALIYSVIDAMPEYTPRNEEILLRLQGNCSTDAFRASTVPYSARFMRFLYNNHPYPTSLHNILRQSSLPNPESSDGELMRFDAFMEQMLCKPESASFNVEIGFLRQLFAKISAELLEPDLVILDEFQRFRYLIDPPEGEDGGEVKVLFERFLGSGASKEANAPRVLMLSATPFKLYSTRAECGQQGEDISFREFKGVIDFLFASDRERAEVWQEWENYTRFLSAFDVSKVSVGDGDATLHERKTCAEAALRRGICRTERSLAETPRDGGSEAENAPILPDPAEIRAWMKYSEWMRELGIGERLRLQYAKSAPYVLSFLANYQDQKQLESALKERGVAELKHKTSASVRRALWVDCSRVKGYREIPWNNARLAQLAAHAFDKEAERLLWIPPTFPCYAPGGPFADRTGYSKVLVFSKWQMVPKMASALLSYEAERRTIAKIRRDHEKLNYFAESRFPPQRLRFGSGMKSMWLFTLLYPSRALANNFSTTETVNGGVATAQEVAGRMARTLRRQLDESGLRNPKDRAVDKRWYYLAPMFLDRATCEGLAAGFCNASGDDSKAGWRHFNVLKRELEAGPGELGRWPEDLCEVLADIALGSPAVCALRAGFKPEVALQVAGVFRGYFNTPEAIAAVACSYMRSDDEHWKNVLRYGRDGCLQAVLDEWLCQIDGQGVRDVGVLQRIKDALDVRSASYRVDTFEALLNRVGGGKREMKSMRTHFAAAFANGEGKGEDEKAVSRRANLRAAFNSPFRPFVLVSTSIGQEGLDFHGYCRKVFHWNLPHNPVDLEQREGRVDRYRGLAVRQNVVAKFAAGKRDFQSDIWGELFAEAERAARADGEQSGLIPNWRNGSDALHRVERIVPLYACSEDETRYRRLTELLSLFRMALGQPNQEALLDRVLCSTHDFSRLRRYFLDLCPFRS